MLMPLFGGVLIGLAVSLMLFLNGRVTGISGIINGVLTYKKGDWGWRVALVLGLISGGFVVSRLIPERIGVSPGHSFDLVIAGLLVGFGTVMGSGCTSGHGVCGLSRFSKRSFLATITFILTGIISATVFAFLKGGR